jgi:hypothetical protein
MHPTLLVSGSAGNRCHKHRTKAGSSQESGREGPERHLRMVLREKNGGIRTRVCELDARTYAIAWNLDQSSLLWFGTVWGSVRSFLRKWTGWMSCCIVCQSGGKCDGYSWEVGSIAGVGFCLRRWFELTEAGCQMIGASLHQDLKSGIMHGAAHCGP